MRKLDRSLAIPVGSRWYVGSLENRPGRASCRQAWAGAGLVGAPPYSALFHRFHACPKIGACWKSAFFFV